jgi:transposase
MKKTTVEEKLAISHGVKWGKSYEQIAAELHLTKRVVQKWGQKVKKKCAIEFCYGSP